MTSNELKIRERVCIASYGPLRGLRGTVRKVYCISRLEDDMLFLFYQVDLEGGYTKEPIWIESEEIAPICQEI